MARFDPALSGGKPLLHSSCPLFFRRGCTGIERPWRATGNCWSATSPRVRRPPLESWCGVTCPMSLARLCGGPEIGVSRRMYPRRCFAIWPGRRVGFRPTSSWRRGFTGPPDLPPAMGSEADGAETVSRWANALRGWSGRGIADHARDRTWIAEPVISGCRGCPFPFADPPNRTAIRDAPLVFRFALRPATPFPYSTPPLPPLAGAENHQGSFKSRFDSFGFTRCKAGNK